MDFELSDKHRMLRASVKEFSDHEIEPLADQMEKDARLPDCLIQQVAQMGLLGMTVPEKYGGGGETNLSCALVVEQLSYSGTGAWWLIAINNTIPACIARFGDEHIRGKYLPPLCQGSAYASVQFTEEETGSDPEALKTRALPQNGYYVLNGMKRFSTFGSRGGYAVIYARDEQDKCTAFIVEKNIEGYQAKKSWDLMGAGGMEAVDVYLEGVKVPQDDMLGEKGKGFGMLLWWVEREKVLQCAANVGMAQAAIDEALKYSIGRMSRGKPISEMQGIRWTLADMHCQVEASRWLTYRAAFLQDSEMQDSGVEAAAAKIFVAQATMATVESARRVHGAYGYLKEFKIERLSRAVMGAGSIATSLEINRSIVGGALVR